ncbi:MAG: leucine-rich repeat protein, partial [Treponemataceae bacterium]|nr:leucine-rich repeat protein [Treponemataceae bacterium]
GAYTDGGDGTHRRTCADCGRTESAPHAYDGETYERGDGGHYRTCTTAGCNAHSPVEAHQYGDEACTETGHAKTCSLCTYSMTAPHNWSGYTNANTDYHSRTCTVTGFKTHSETKAHDYGTTYSDNKDGTHYQTCAVCGGTSDPVSHGYEYKDNADGSHTKTCKAGCGYSKDIDHNWSGYTNTGADYHSRTCTVTGFKPHSETKAHEWGASYTDNKDGKHYQTCSVCNGQSTAVAHTVSYNNGNDSTHTKTCTANCGYSESEAHTWGGETYTAAEHSKTCSLCTYSKTAPHSWSGYTDGGDGYHSRTCAPEGFEAHTDRKAHTYGTCTDNGNGYHTKTCSACTYVCTEAHGYTYTRTDAVHHSGVCTGAGCNARVEGERHVYSGDSCGGCESPKPVLEGGTINDYGSLTRYTGTAVTLEIPEGVTCINYKAFEGCPSLMTVYIPVCVTTIYCYAFKGCTNLTTVIIPGSVTTLDSSVFENCTSLTTVTISEGVTSIDIGTFASCTSLTTVSIPVSVTEISAWAFDDCKKLATVYYAGTKAQWEAITISSAWDMGTGNYTIVCTDGTIPK